MITWWFRIEKCVQIKAEFMQITITFKYIELFLERVYFGDNWHILTKIETYKNADKIVQTCSTGS